MQAAVLFPKLIGVIGSFNTSAYRCFSRGKFGDGGANLQGELVYWRPSQPNATYWNCNSSMFGLRQLSHPVSNKKTIFGR